MSRVTELPCGWRYDATEEAALIRRVGEYLPLRYDQLNDRLVMVGGGDAPDGSDGSAAAAHLYRCHGDLTVVTDQEPLELWYPVGPLAEVVPPVGTAWGGRGAWARWR